MRKIHFPSSYRYKDISKKLLLCIFLPQRMHKDHKEKVVFKDVYKKFLSLVIALGFLFYFIPQANGQNATLSGSAQPASDIPIYLDTNYTFRERAADLVSRMTLEEEVRQLHTNHAPAIPRLGVHQYFYWNEAQHGVNALFGNLNNGNSKKEEAYGSPRATSFPVNFASTMTWDPQLIYKETSAISDEVRGFLDKSLFGVAQNNLGDSRDNYGSLTFWAPTINMDRDPRWGRTDEAFGEDPYLASRMAAAFVNGFQGQTMNGIPETKYLKAAATAKHYALNNLENNRTGISSNTDDEAIRDYYTAPFRHLIEDAHVSGIMTSYNAINGTPAVANTYTINVLAKRTYGFKGYTTSDCGAVGTTYNTFPGGHFWAPPGWRVSRDHNKTIWINTQTGDTVSGAAGGQAFAVRAGTSLNCTGYEYTLSNIEEAIKAGILSKGVIDRALTSVFTIRMRTGEFDPTSAVPYTRLTKAEIQSPAHQKLAEEVAENALVLLKNEPVSGTKKALLPLHPEQLHRVLIIGNLANEVSLGGYSGDPKLKVSAVQGITAVFKKMNRNIVVKFDSTNSSVTSADPVRLNEKIKSDIREADAVIVFIGTNEAVGSEGHDRPSLAIPGNYLSLIYQVAEQGNKHLILAIQSDGPLNINYIQHYFPAIVFSGYNGESQGTALADVLTGKKNPGAHLDFTWYMNDDQLADKSDYYLAPGKTNGLGRTYQYFTRKPLYPFGYGLSYTRFRFSNFSVSPSQISPDDSVTVSFDVTNTGNLSGTAVAQLYVTYPKIHGIDLPIKRLKGFQKTDMLAPGQREHISLSVKGIQLANWNQEKQKEVVYNGNYQFQLGKDSRDITDTQTVNIQGALTPKVIHVTIEPEDLVYKTGDKLNLKGKNKWIESDVTSARQGDIPDADHIIEAVNNDGSFLDLSQAKIDYQSDNHKVAQVSPDGIVSFLSPGVATVSAIIDGVKGSAVFVVK